jgi:hypothetical protein
MASTDERDQLSPQHRMMHAFNSSLSIGLVM